MSDYTRYVGLDVHKDSVSMHVVWASGEEGETARLPNDPSALGKALRRVVREAGGREKVRCCYEAGPCGYVLYRQLREMGISCAVVAPSLTPVRPGERVKTDRRDARKLARMERAGELVGVWVPDEEHEGLRDLVRARESARQDLLRARHRLSKFLLRHGKTPPQGISPWSRKHEQWLDALTFEVELYSVVLEEYRQQMRASKDAVERLEKQMHAVSEKSALRPMIQGLQALRGVSFVTAATLGAEIGDISRFTHPGQLMSYAGLTPSEYSSGAVQRRGKITKMGNPHLRRVLVESAWHYRHTPSVGPQLRQRQQGQSEQVKAVSWKAQLRLNTRYRQLMGRGKEKNRVVVAVARELCAFVWELAWTLKAQSVVQAG
jgi:transposase